ncbi:MAG: phosphoribosylglycinamide formyltransferase [Bacteroidia bacterium]
MKTAVIFASGEGTNAENLIAYFKNNPKIKFKYVITNNEEAGVIKRAEKLNKSIHIISKKALNEYTDQIIDFLKGENIDLIILAGFLLKIPEKLVKSFPNQIINIHPSLLPKYGGKGMHGMNVHKAVIENKEKKSGITIHYVNEEYDKGAIIAQFECEILSSDNADDLVKKIRALELKHFPEVVETLL